MSSRAAHLLVQVEPGRSAQAVQHLAQVPSVTAAVATSGPYDVIATIDAADEQALSAALRLARRAPGLCALRVCRGT